ncbi:MAG: hypothetical protein FJ388_07200 [Verrucomicrobia bacterium]|nr:hypothetical protein [Verrucomicrobiota bacterium]
MSLVRDPAVWTWQASNRNSTLAQVWNSGVPTLAARAVLQEAPVAGKACFIRRLSQNGVAASAVREGKSELQGRNPAHARSLKKHCEDCTHYRNCPRMRGENVCHGLLPDSALT